MTKLICGLLAIFLVACTPVQHIDRPSADLQTGPKLADVDLGFTAHPPIASAILFAADLSAADTYRFTENLLKLKNTLQATARENWISKFVTQVPHDNLSILDPSFVYVDILLAQAQQMSAPMLTELGSTADATAKTLITTVTDTRLALDNSSTSTMTKMADEAFTYLRSLDQSVASSGVGAGIAGAFHAAIAKYLAMESQVSADCRNLDASQSIVALVGLIDTSAADIGISVPRDLQAKLMAAKAIGQKVDALTDAESALNFLVGLWSNTSPRDRKATFEPVSVDLYNYLNGLTASDLKCLTDKSCFSFSEWIAKSSVILPKITAYGIQNIQAKVNTMGIAQIHAQLIPAVSAELAKLPAIVLAGLNDGIQAEEKKVSDFKTDIVPEIKGRLADWAKQTIEKNGPAIFRLKPAKAHLTASPQQGGRTELNFSWSSLDQFTPEDVGEVSSLFPALWQDSATDEETARSLMLSRVYQLAKDRQDGSMMSRDIASLSATGYAEIVRGTSTLAISLKDSATGIFDRYLSVYQAQALFPEFPSPQLEISMFPKDAFYAIALSDLATSLKIIKSDKTQLFLVDSDNHVQPMTTAAGSDPAVMVGIADRTGTQLSSVVRAEDIARYLLSMCKVMTVLKTVTSTKSSYLLTPGSDGSTPKDELLGSQSDLRLLILGLANFLSHQMRPDGYLVHHDLNIQTNQPVDGGFYLRDQALAIRALVGASQVLGMDLYKWEATDILSAMNQKLYRPELAFYGGSGDKSVSPPDLLETLRAFEVLSPLLKPTSQDQVTALMQAWKKQIATWSNGQ